MTMSLRADSAPAPTAGISEAPAAAAGDAPADPVKALIRQHHALCAGAIDSLEIAAGLEARGISDRVAAEFRHRDVFSLAEELHARVDRDETTVAGAVPMPAAPQAPDARAHRHGPCAVLTGAWGATGPAAWLWLTGYALVGDQILAVLLHGRRGRSVHALASLALSTAAPTALALACAVAPAAWCAHWFAARAREALADSRGLGEFAARVRPVLLTAVALFLGALSALLWPARTALPAAAPPGGSALAYAAVAALGGLLFLSRQLAAHGLPGPAARAGLAAALAEALPLLALLAARLPGCEPLGWPVRWAAEAYGPAAIPLVACALPALALLAHAVPALSRACVHGHAGPPHTPHHPCDATDDLGTSPLPTA
ncbi:hypothetical protein FHS39_000440 [Streptomyces olivoverticillatus]|uniref:Integral membrane protein n=1 Tax=Streptomyces olivoverticillatus TaxID=66427 RepID=A0A7W7PK47_9ACTN|nr:hypothetical protein [Streptomyces olivoverticillatus]MBB4891440.1 hypothetical protein [Streptomyces olivoverticillatus]